MAFLLYRLGKFAYRRRWWVVSAWLAVILAVGGAAAAFSGTLTTNFSIPGTESQRISDQLKEEMPQAVGGTGTVVFETADGGTFTAVQQDAVQEALADVADLGGVSSVVEPFEVERQVEDGRTELEDGQAELSAGEQEMAERAAELEAAQAELAAQREQFEQNRPFLPNQQAQATEAQLDEAQVQLDAGAAELADGRAALAQSRAELELAQRTLAASSAVSLISEDGSAAVATIQFEGRINAVTPELRAQVQAEAGAAAASGVAVNYSQDIVQDVSEIFGAAEIIGLMAAAVVLIVMLGTLVAAGLPLLMAIVGVGVGVGITFALSGLIEMNSVSPMLALMLGLAVGIDYSLFIVNRYRTQVLQGMHFEESAGRAAGTAGNAVLFAGLTVVIALAALAVPGLPFLTIMGLAAAGTVAVSVLVALTLTPALLGFIGTRIISKRRWAAAGGPGAAGNTAFGAGSADAEAVAEAAVHDEPAANGGGVVANGLGAAKGRGWGGLVTRKPVFALIGGILLLGLIAVPAAQLRVGLPDGGSEPVDSTAFAAYSTVGEKFGAGTNGPLLVVGAMPPTAGESELTDLRLDVNDRLLSVPDVSAAVPASVSEDGRTALFQVIPAEGPASESTENLVRELRNASEAMEADTGVAIAVTGQTAANIDVSAKLMDAMPLYLGIVVGLSMLLLLLVFRSILVPLIATGGFLLSLLASFGATVAIYQWGWLGEVFGVANPGPILSFLPIILIGVLFGLAMDYQMFLVSGMREAYMHGADPRSAVRLGFSSGARVVTAAAIIMVAVFAGFVFSHLTMVRPIGFGLAFGVLVDAFVVRMTLVPAAMHLLGRRAWWLPKWLDRVLPDVDVEGAKLSNAMAMGADEPRPRPADARVPV